MAGSFPTLQRGPATYQVSQAVTGGQLVEPDSTTGFIKPAAATSVAVLGVALGDAVPAGSGSNTNFATARYEVAVAYGPAEAILTVAGGTAVAFGEAVVSAAAGTVAHAASPTFGQIVARCTEPAGVASGSSGRFRLYV